MHHCKDVLGEVSFQTFKRTEDNNRQIWSIRDVDEKVDDWVLDNILFLHIWTGCDTTSGTYGMSNESLYFFPSFVLIITVLLMKSIPYRLRLTGKSHTFLIWINISFQFYQINKLWLQFFYVGESLWKSIKHFVIIMWPCFLNISYYKCQAFYCLLFI